MVSIATYLAILVPRAHLLAEAVTQGMFMAGMYQLFCLIVAYCGGEAELIKKVKHKKLILKVGPCCCWPCCCFPTYDLNKSVKTLILSLIHLQLIQVYTILVWQFGILVSKICNSFVPIPIISVTYPSMVPVGTYYANTYGKNTAKLTCPS